MTERTMTLTEAAALLEVPVDAEPEQVERAYRYQAQRSHPDRLAAATPAEVAAAAARFDRCTLARAVLRAADAERRLHSPAAGSGSTAGSAGNGAAAGASARTGRAAEGSWTGPVWAADEPYQPSVPAGPWLFWVWTGLYLLGAVISFLGGPLPYSQADLWLRLLPLGLAAAGFARTGRRGFLAAVVVWGAATAVLTILFASFGPLVAMILLSTPVIGLVALGHRRQLGRVGA